MRAITIVTKERLFRAATRVLDFSWEKAIFAIPGFA
jgi:hypothetical protein